MNSVKPILTDDGSYTLFVPELNEHYHSTFGAAQESLHVFIQNGLKYFLNQNPDVIKVRIFEMGFGTGLNAFLTWLNTKNLNLKIEYTAVEKFPLDFSIIEQLNIGNYFQDAELEDVYKQFHTSEWENPVVFGNFILKKIKTDILDYNSDNQFDIIYFDAFAPALQPEIWSKTVFEKMFRQLSTQGVLTTYSAKGNVRRLLQEAGFTVEKIAGPKGKRHILRGVNL